MQPFRVDFLERVECGESDTAMVLIVGAQELFHRPPRPLQNPRKQRRHRPSHIDPLLDGCADLCDERPFRMLRGERKRRWRFLTQVRQAFLDERGDDPRIMSCTKIQAPPFSAALRFFRILVNEAHQLGCLTDFRIGPTRVGRIRIGSMTNTPKMVSAEKTIRISHELEVARVTRGDRRLLE